LFRNQKLEFEYSLEQLKVYLNEFNCKTNLAFKTVTL